MIRVKQINLRSNIGAYWSDQLQTELNSIEARGATTVISVYCDPNDSSLVTVIYRVEANK